MCKHRQVAASAQDPQIEVRPVPFAGEASTWNITTNISDRWGDVNPYHARNPAAKQYIYDEVLQARLRDQMWDEATFVVRKDGQYGILFEAEYLSRESEQGRYQEGDPFYADLKPHEEVAKALIEKMAALPEKFPGVLFAVPHESAVYHGRPAVWAFVADGLLSEAQRKALGDALLDL